MALPTRVEQFLSILRSRRHEVDAYRCALTTPVATYPRFVVFAGYRTGSHLLKEILSTPAGAYCDGEIFIRFCKTRLSRVLLPELYVWGCLAKRGSAAYGCILRQDQLAQIGVVPRDFLRRLYQEGWKFVHLKRENLLRQTISSLVAKYRNIWHFRQEEARVTPIHLSPGLILKEMEKLEKFRDGQEESMAYVPHFEVVYERDLLDASQHQSTRDRTLNYLGLATATYSPGLRRTTPDNLAEVVQNYEEVQGVIGGTRFSRYLDQGPAASP